MRTALPCVIHVHVPSRESAFKFCMFACMLKVTCRCRLHPISRSQYIKLYNTINRWWWCWYWDKAKADESVPDRWPWCTRPGRCCRWRQHYEKLSTGSSRPGMYAEISPVDENYLLLAAHLNIGRLTWRMRGRQPSTRPLRKAALVLSNCSLNTNPIWICRYCIFWAFYACSSPLLSLWC